jgi:tetratricopeptide (TPR) repeat protein
MFGITVVPRLLVAVAVVALGPGLAALAPEPLPELDPSAASLAPGAGWQLAGRDLLADSARREIEAGAARADRARLVAARALLERALTAFPDDPLLLHYQGYALWREAALVLGTGTPRDARPLLQEADRVLERSAARLRLPESYALRASVLGQLIGTSRNPLDGMRLGPRSSSLMEQAEAAGPQNPRVWLLRGMNAMYTPGMFGGGMDRAEASLQRALTLLAADRPAPPLPAWGEADVHIYLGQVYAKQGRTEEARAAFERALALQPGNPWVRQVLLPALDRPAR